MKESNVTVGANLIKQAAKLLEATPNDPSSIVEVCFNADNEIIEVWGMVADSEKLLGMANYD